MKRPFYSKTKLLYQTKISLRPLNKKHLARKLKKKKWGFLKGRRPLANFSFVPLSFNKHSRRRRKLGFKNRIYLRKFLRLKYSRMKNKELRGIARKSRGYAHFIAQFGSRLDVNLSRLLRSGPSVFYLRQNILHGKVLLNNRRMKNPNKCLEPMDIISFKLSDLSHNNFLYDNLPDRIVHLRWLLDALYLKGFQNLDKGFAVKEKFIKHIVTHVGKDKIVSGGRDSEIIEKEIKMFFRRREASSTERPVRGSRPAGGKKARVPLSKFIHILNNKFLLIEFSKVFRSYEKKHKLEASLGKGRFCFFNKGLHLKNYELCIRGDYVDALFLGAIEHRRDIDSDRYLLNYLY